jgi:hypothetical protein
MQIRHVLLRRRGRGLAGADRSPVDASSAARDERGDVAWGDERQVAVWGQVSARTLYLVVALNVIAGSVFNTIDSSRYGPCVTVFFAIALGATAWAGWTARRKGVDVRAPRAASRTRLVAGSLVFGIGFYALDRLAGGGHRHDSWLSAVLTIAGYSIGFGIGFRFLAAWQRRQALRSQEAPDDLPAAPDPMF